MFYHYQVMEKRLRHIVELAVCCRITARARHMQRKPCNETAGTRTLPPFGTGEQPKSERTSISPSFEHCELRQVVDRDTIHRLDALKESSQLARHVRDCLANRSCNTLELSKLSVPYCCS